MSSFGNSPGMHLQDLILVTKATATKEQKVDCLKLLRIVVKNLSDPLKSQDPKYRQLRLSNEKVRAKLLPCPSAVEYMKAIGFMKITDDDGAEYLRIEAGKDVNVINMQASLVELTNAVEMLAPDALSKSPASSAPPSRSSSTGSFAGVEEKKTPEGIIVRRSDSSVSASSASGRMSEKQKARALLEQKRKREQEEAREARARTSAQIKVDKHVRRNDENWKSGQSAACVKGGTGISTFRDKYGEN